LPADRDLGGSPRVRRIGPPDNGEPAVAQRNDDVAAGLLETFDRAGVGVPADVSIVGWDDSSLARLPHLDLTTVRQDAEQMTRLAVDLSVARLTTAPSTAPSTDREVVLSPELIIRASTGPVHRAEPVSEV